MFSDQAVMWRGCRPTCPHSPGIQRGGGQRPKLQRIRTGGLLWLGQWAGGKVLVRSLLLHKAMRCLKPGPHLGVHWIGRRKCEENISTAQWAEVGFRILSYLWPIQSDPLWWAGLVVARLPFDRSVGQTVGVLQRLLLSRANLPDTQDCPRPHPAVTCLPTLRPVTNKPPGGEKHELKLKNQS